MKCAIHLGTAMVAVKTLAPRFVVTCDGMDSDGKPKRRRRTIFKCPISGCMRVAMAEDDGIDWGQARMCRICRKNPANPELAARHDYRCNECIRTRQRSYRHARGATIAISRTAEVFA